MASVLDLFEPPVSRWFNANYATPTPPQELGWPHIARGENTLILAPTGSGKTLAAFLYAINELVARGAAAGKNGGGVHTIYISPLRALAADIERNLEAPLDGIRACAVEMEAPIPQIGVGVRTGDTTPAERQRMLRHPPDLLITTPESLHLLLTARRSREILRDVRYVIVDEIHTLCGEKRGSFLSLLLERLEQLAGRPLIRVGLSATQRPLARVARFLGGFDSAGEPRPVSVVDCGMRKDLDLAVVAPVPDMQRLPHPDGHAPSVWPAIYAQLLDLTRTHASTLIFANNRRAVERIAAEMNRLAGERMVRAHHGSVSKEYRREIEADLKAGRLPALVATSSLELGIDMGAIDLVCQVETPTSVASALQRVGRAGHAFRAKSAGRMIPKTRSDLLRMAGMARSMLRGEISEVRVPKNPLDVLAQQVVAMVAVEDWNVDAIYDCVRQADPFHRLPRSSFDAVLDMVSGGYHSPAFPGLRARLLWERTTGRLSALPGALHAAIAAGGTIPDTGQYAMVLDDGKTRLGELDEEFVFERRIGDTFVLGTGRWKIVDMRHDRVVVSPSAAEEAQLPFWKGEGLGHDAEFGRRLGAFVAECRQRRNAGDLIPWLEGDCALDAAAALNLSGYLDDQDAVADLPDDGTILVDVFPSDTGDLRVGVVSTFGRSFHVALWLALRAELRRSGQELPEGIVSNEGILFRPGAVRLEVIERALGSLRDGDIRARLVEELRDSPYFALKFRRNAGRALLLPRSRPGKRVPLWLQRLRSHDLLTYASEHPRFPIVAETYREILDDALPVAALEGFARRLAAGEARFSFRRGSGPSPMVGALVLDFVGKYMYEADQPAARTTPADDDLLGELLESSPGAELVSADAVGVMEERLQGLSAFHRARDGAESIDLLLRIGDLTDDELGARCEPDAASALDGLEREGRIRRVRVPLTGGERLVAADDASAYAEGNVDVARILLRYVWTHAGRTEAEIRTRYPGATAGDVARLEGDRVVRADLPGRPAALLDRDVLVGLRRATLSARRREAAPVPVSALAAAVLRRQHIAEPLSGSAGLREVLDQLAGWLAPVAVWPEILAARLENPERIRLDPLVRGGMIEWRGARLGGTRVLGFAPAGAEADLLPHPEGDPAGMAARVVEYLLSSGASFLHQVAAGVSALPASVDEALWELTWSGWVTNDSLVAALRPGPGRGVPTPGLGRWSVVAERAARDREEGASLLLSVLLSRYGFLSREILDREPIGVRWSEAYPLLSRMEWRGEVDRGLFVSGLSGLQFAIPGMQSELRKPSEGGVHLLHVMDPALLMGDVVRTEDAPRRGPGNYVIVEAGRPLVGIEARAARLVPLVDLSAEERRAALALLPLLVRHVGQLPRIRVETWAGVPAAASEAAADLAALGFVRDDQAMVLYRSFGGAA